MLVVQVVFLKSAIEQILPPVLQYNEHSSILQSKVVLARFLSTNHITYYSRVTRQALIFQGIYKFSKGADKHIIPTVAKVPDGGTVRITRTDRRHDLTTPESGYFTFVGIL